MLRVVHVDQRAQPHPGVQLLARHVVALGSGQQRPGFVDEQIVGPLDFHDVGVLGDGPERPVGPDIDQRHRRMGAQVGQRRMQPRFVGIRRRISEYPRCLVKDWCAHLPVHLPD